MRVFRKIHQDQSGLVSIIVALIFITILSLITLSFALLMRRESRQALDRQLSSQAFYAAESGINDAVSRISTLGSNDECDDNPSGKSSNLGNGLEYTCLLVNQAPQSLDYQEVGTNDSTITRVKADTPIQKIRISWNSTDGSENFATNNDHWLPQAAFSASNSTSFSYIGGGTGIMRMDLIPLTGALSRNTITNNAQTAFLYPKTGNSNSTEQRGYSANSANQGDFIDGNCNTERSPRFCSIEITSLPANTTTYYLRLKSIYHASNVVVQAYATNSSTTPLPLVGTQVVIDATGKANDVLRRVQVRVPLKSSYYYPEFALESADDICKLIVTIPPNTVDRAKDNACHAD